MLSTSTLLYMNYFSTCNVLKYWVVSLYNSLYTTFLSRQQFVVVSWLLSRNPMHRLNRKELFEHPVVVSVVFFVCSPKMYFNYISDILYFLRFLNTFSFLRKYIIECYINIVWWSSVILCISFMLNSVSTHVL